MCVRSSFEASLLMELAPRLQSIQMAENNVTSISPSLPPNVSARRRSTLALLKLSDSEPCHSRCAFCSTIVAAELTEIVLTNNAISSLASLVPLESLVYLRYLSLRGNPVTEQEHYREFTVWKVARGKLHTLDFTRIKDSVRTSAVALLTDASTGLPNALAHQLSTPTTSAIPGATVSAASKTAARAVAAAGKGGKGRLMTPEEKRRVAEALARASTAEEMRKLERMLAEGLTPEDGGVAEIEVNGT